MLNQILKKLIDEMDKQDMNIEIMGNQFRQKQTDDFKYILDLNGGLFNIKKLEEFRNEENKKKLFFLCGAMNNSNIVSDDGQKVFSPYIVSLEMTSLKEDFLMTTNKNEKLVPLTSFGIRSSKSDDRIEVKEIVEELSKQPDFLRKELIRGQGKNKTTMGYAVFIRIPTVEEKTEKTVTVDGVHYDVTNLWNYFICSDSRTYKDAVYVTNWIATEMHKNNAKNLGLPRNLLIYGAPGTGKSHYIDDKFEKDFYCVPEETEKLEQYRKELSEKLGIDIPEDADIKATIKNEFFTRVTFYKDYSYENFVGCYKPIKKDDKITYEFEAGSFIDIYIKAKKDSKHNYLLAIEEINRANAAAVFGDLFQVLDRDNDGSSEYSVKPEAALNKYLEEHLPNYDGTISLPSNLYIWATMNSADQGVHVLDSAFKRRWQFLYMDIDNSESAAKIDDDIYLPVKDGIRKCKWNQFRKAINKVLKDNKIEEDRWVGAWFFKKDELKLIRTFYENKDNTKLKPNPLVDKLLAYLLQDVVKMNKDILFKTDYHNMSSIRKALSNSNSPKNIFDILNIKIDENALEEVPKTENPTPTNAESAPNGQGEQTQVVTENG